MDSHLFLYIWSSRALCCLIDYVRSLGVSGIGLHTQCNPSVQSPFVLLRSPLLGKGVGDGDIVVQLYDMIKQARLVFSASPPL